MNVVIPGCVMLITVAGLAGPNEMVTGAIAVKTIVSGVSGYLGCRLYDWLATKPWECE
jgi:hypothetical protein